MIQANGLFKRYTLPHKTVDVLEDAALSVQPGERVAIIGRSGSGKSTLLHLLGGLDRPDKGRVDIAGHTLYALSARRRARIRATLIGFVFQAYHLLPEMNILENVMLPAMAAGALGRRDMRRRAEELLVQVGLKDRLTHTPLELSGGEQQRAAIARALMNRPPLLLADEPTGNLDRDTGSQVLDTLFGLSQTREHALVMVTHSPEIARLCDRVLILEHGRLQPYEEPAP